MTKAETLHTRSGNAPRENMQIAERLRTYAGFLENQGDDGFRIRAYRAAADQVERMDKSLREIHRNGGSKALIALPAIGRGIAAAIVEILSSGRWVQLERLQEEATPEQIFQTVPGVGPVLADRFATLLDAQDLEELEAMLADPKMNVPGLGPRRRRAILAALSDRLEPIRRDRSRRADPANEPPVSLLLEADALYRKKDSAGELRQIAPRRFNPEGVAWLPVLHLRRGDWHLTLLYSTTQGAPMSLTKHGIGLSSSSIMAMRPRHNAPSLHSGTAPLPVGELSEGAKTSAPNTTRKISASRSRRFDRQADGERRSLIRLHTRQRLKRRRRTD